MLSFNFRFEAIGTLWEVDIKNPPVNISEKALLKDVLTRIESFDKSYSRFREDSFVKKLSQKKGAFNLPQNAKPMLDLYRNLYSITEGNFSPLIGSLMENAGYDSNYSLTPKKITRPQTWKETIASYTNQKIYLKKPVLFDFGAAGKGYLIDLIAEFFLKNKINSFTIDAGGDILHKGDSPLRVGLENPLNLKQVIGVINIQNQNICSSSGNRRKWRRFHHIINPNTLSSPKNILATWTTAENTMIADGLSTCLFFENPDKLKKYYKFEYLILKNDFSIKKSKGFYAELF
jgi:FAD:protein FMN transferase